MDINSSGFANVSDVWGDLPWHYYVYKYQAPLFALLLFLAAVGNALVLVVARWIRKEISVNLYLCLSLAAVDAWASLLGSVGRSFYILNTLILVITEAVKKTTVYPILTLLDFNISKHFV